MADWSTPGAAEDATTAPAASDPSSAPATGGGWSTPGAAGASAWSTPGEVAAAPAAAAPKAAGHKGLLSQLGSIFSPAKIATGIYHLGGDVAQTVGVSPTQVLAHVKGIDPWYTPGATEQEKSSSPGVNALFGDQTTGQKGAHVFAQQAPALAGAATHLAKTALVVPDLAVNAAEDTTGSGPGLANSIAGRRIHSEGVLGAGLSTLGDALVLAGGAGAGLDAVGAGDAAEATRLSNLANAVKVAPEGGYESAAQASHLADAAAQAGKATEAGEHAAAAENLTKAEGLQAKVAAQGPVMQGLNSVRSGLNTFEHLGNQVAGAPVELYTKVLPKLVGAIPGVSDALSAARDAIGNTQFAKDRGDLSQFRDIYKDQVTGEQQRLTQPVKVAFNDAAKLTPAVDDQIATQLVRRGDVNALTAPQLDAMSDAQLQAHIDRTGIQATVPALRTAIDYTRDPAAHPEITQAAQILDSVQAPADVRFVNGIGSSKTLGDGALAERQAKVAGEASPAGIAKIQAQIRNGPLATVESEADAIRQRNLEPQAGELTSHGQRQVAADQATVRSIRRFVQKEEARTARTATAGEAAGARVEAAGNNRIGSIAGQAREQLEGLRTTAADAKAQVLRDQAAQIAEQTNSQAGALQAQGLAGNVDTTQPGWYLTKAGAERARLGNQAEEAQAAGAAEATAKRAQAEQVEPTKVKGGGKIQAQTNRKVTVANARTGGEAAATERLTAAEAGRQSRAESGARGALAKAEETAGARAERLQSDAAARAFRNDTQRLGTLAERRDVLEGKIAAAPNELKVQAPQVRTALQGAAQVRESLLQAAHDAHASGDVAEGQRLAGLAGKQNLSAAELKAAGVEPSFLPGSEVPEKTPGVGGKPRLSSVKKLGSERMRETNTGPLDYESQRAVYEHNISGQVRNQLNTRVLNELATPAASHVEDASLAGPDLVAALGDKGRMAVGMVRKNGVDTLDQLPDAEVTADSPTMSNKIFGQYKKQTAPAELSKASKALRTAENAGRLTKLLGPGFVLHKGITDLVLDKIAGGVGPKELAAHIPEALSQYKDDTLPANIGTLSKPNPENMSLADRALGKVAEKGMVGFRATDSTNRGALYGALRDQGLSPVQAEERVQAVAGNIGAINQQVGGLRHVVTYPGWQVHLAKILASMPVEHLSGMLQAGAVAGAANQATGPDQNPTTGGLDDVLNPFGSMLGLGKGNNKSLGTQIQKRIGSMIAPLPEVGAQVVTGNDLRKGRSIQVPNVPYTQAPGGQLVNPGNAANMALHTLVPQFGQVQDVVGRANTPAGFIPYRDTTGNPETKNGAANVEPGTTRLGALASLLGLPVAQHVAKPATKKRTGR